LAGQLKDSSRDMARGGVKAKKNCRPPSRKQDVAPHQDTAKTSVALLTLGKKKNGRPPEKKRKKNNSL